MRWKIAALAALALSGCAAGEGGAPVTTIASTRSNRVPVTQTLSSAGEPTPQSLGDNLQLSLRGLASPPVPAAPGQDRDAAQAGPKATPEEARRAMASIVASMPQPEAPAARRAAPRPARPSGATATAPAPAQGLDQDRMRQLFD